MMISTYLRFFLRMLGRSRLNSLLTVIGLTLGLSVAVQALAVIWNEGFADRQWRDSQRVFRVSTRLEAPGRDPQIQTRSFGPLSGTLADSDLNIEDVGRLVIQWDNLEVRDRDLQFSAPLHVVDTGFLSIFNFDYVAGNAAAPFADASSIILTESMAERLFGDAEPIGQTINHDQGELKVSAVIRDLQRSHLDMDVLIPLDSPIVRGAQAIEASWGSLTAETYVKLAPGVSVARLETAANKLLNDKASLRRQRATKVSAVVTPLHDIYLGTADYLSPYSNLGEKRSLWIIGFIGVLVLATACINHINLATAQGLRRAREIALRKICGADQRHLVQQFLGETLLVVLISFAAAVGLTNLTLPYLGDFLVVEFDSSYLWQALAAPVVGLLAIVTLLAGAYPALVVSRYRPERIFSEHDTQKPGKIGFRAALLVVQFAVSISLIVATLIILSQNRYINRVDLGFDSSDIVILYGARRSPQQTIDINRQLKAAMVNEPDIVTVAGVSSIPAWDSQSQVVMRERNAPIEENQTLGSLAVDTTFLELFGLEVIAGRGFSDSFAQDRAQFSLSDRAAVDMPIILNASGVRSLGFDDPQAIIGTYVEVELDAGGTARSGEVVGVLPDFHTTSLREPIKPMVFYLDPADSNAILVKLEPGAGRVGMQALERGWSQVFPYQRLASDFLSDALDRLYDTERRQFAIIGVMAVLAILISALGLYGMAALAAEQRRLEIGVRKVLGADILDIMKLMLWRYAKPVLAGNLIAWPVSYLLMSRWLEDFAYRIEMTPWPFLFAGIAALALAWTTVGGHTYSLARTHPAHVLRHG